MGPHRPWLLGMLIYEGVKLRKKGTPPGIQVTPTLTNQTKSSAESQLIHSAN